jgi:hypothetical protein
MTYREALKINCISKNVTSKFTDVYDRRLFPTQNAYNNYLIPTSLITISIYRIMDNKRFSMFVRIPEMMNWKGEILEEEHKKKITERNERKSIQPTQRQQACISLYGTTLVCVP